MSFKLIGNEGLESSPAMVAIYASGTVQRNSVVEFSRTGGVGVFPASSSSATTGVFGVCVDYAQGASDTIVKVIPFQPGQLWAADCVNSASTAQIGLDHVLNDNLTLRNTATNFGAGNVNTAVFRAVAMTGATTGSGTLIGYFRGGPAQDVPMPSNSSTFN